MIQRIKETMKLIGRNGRNKERKEPPPSVWNDATDQDKNLAKRGSMTKKIKETMDLIRRNGGNKKIKEPPTSVWNDASDQDKNLAGWVSPVYNKSRMVILDPLLLAKNRCLPCLDNPTAEQSFEILRTQVLQRTREPFTNTLMVTSALPGEGKTLTAINLAVSIARDFQRTVMLVDSDLRKQSIHKYLGCPGDKGLIDYLIGNTPVSQLITWPGIEKITLISGGRLLHESAEILGSPRMRELVPGMKGRYPDRYIIFDVPPILTGADALTMATLVDKILVVVQAGKTSMDDVKKALQYFPKEKILGLVLNRC
ncbi:MAG TPA: P-loop NTPase [Nitrospirota bacterium]|nr:P-loop NTPase [Nitrospirota bacterium]